MKVKCTYGSCQNEGKYATFELHENMKKIWRTDLCDDHDTFIDTKNRGILRGHNIKDFKESE